MSKPDKSDKPLLNIRWDINILNKIIGYCYKRVRYITNSNLRNVQTLLRNCDLSLYKNRPVILDRVSFILKILEARLDRKFEDEGLVLAYATSDGHNQVIDEIVNNLDRYSQLNFQETDFLTSFIEDRLKYGILIDKISVMKNIIEQVESEEYSTYSEIDTKTDNWIHDYMATKRQVSSMWQSNILDFNDPNLEERVKEINTRLGDSSSILITGVKMLNEMLSPGFRPGKLYIFLGVSGGFKSAILLKIIIDCARFNSKTFKPKREGMKPYVLYVTMENSIDESFARVWNMTIDNTDVEKHSSSEIVERLKKEKVVANDNMGIAFAYFDNMSISTQGIRDLIDNMALQGKEVCLVSFDYIGRIMPVQKARDEKEMLKHVTNELKLIASDYQIPVVTAHQLNRNALTTINSAIRDNKADLARFLGADNISTAIEVQWNADMLIGLNLERKKDTNQLYITFVRMKERYKPQSNLTYFNQPFHRENEFMIQNDIMLTKTLGIISLATDMEGVDANGLFNSRGRTQHKHPSMSKGNTTDDIFDLEPLQ